jgi:hypothetical protein
MCFEGHLLIKWLCAKRRLFPLNKEKVLPVGYFISISVLLYTFFYEIDATSLGITLLWNMKVKMKAAVLYGFCTHVSCESKARKHTYLRLTSVNKTEPTWTEAEFRTWFVRRSVKLKLIDLYISDLSYTYFGRLVYTSCLTYVQLPVNYVAGSNMLFIDVNFGSYLWWLNS